MEKLGQGENTETKDAASSITASGIGNFLSVFERQKKKLVFF